MHTHDADATVPLLNDLLDQYGIREYVRAGKIALVCDSAARKIARLICEDNTSLCITHHLQNFLKRTFDNMKEDAQKE
jgi:hypothetical protein